MKELLAEVKGAFLPEKGWVILSTICGQGREDRVLRFVRKALLHRV